MPNDQRRRHFRIDYPSADRPVFRIGGADFAVVDIAEGGLRFEPQLKKFKPQEQIRGVITFADKASFIVHGHVLREDRGQIIVILAQGIPLARMLSEERYIIQKYGRKTG